MTDLQVAVANLKDHVHALDAFAKSYPDAPVIRPDVDSLGDVIPSLVVDAKRVTEALKLFGREHWQENHLVAGQLYKYRNGVKLILYMTTEAATYIREHGRTV